ncbi:SKP1-like protein 1B isoform X1 [Carex littledalei]|uniref:SKP1-like protein n=1 Tax=Carex littledalei TaxID=544730 RepID=A0A833V9A3_9POAL|nr:SKP1-like protein 1B isoform X1 [Carex littledalei]
MSDNMTDKKVTLKSSDGTELVVSETVAKQSTTICGFIEARSPIDPIDPKGDPIPIPNVNAQILKMVIKYCEKCVEAADEAETETIEEGSSTTQASSRISDKELRIWDEQFGGVNLKTLLSLLNAANYLHIQGLLKVTCKKVAGKMERMRVEEIRQAFNITNDYTAEEEEKIRQEHHWAFE